MSLADIKAKLSSREFKGAGPVTPLRDFKGVLKNFDVEETSYGQGADARVGIRVALDFEGLEVLVSTEPYDYNTAQITIPFSENLNSRWGIFKSSALKLVPEEADWINYMVDKEVRLEYKGGGQVSNRAPDGTWSLVEIESWMVTEIEGGASGDGAQTDVLSHLLTLLNGKNLQQFQSEALKDDRVKGSGYVDSILSGTFIPTQMADGKVEMDANGIYKVL